MHARTPPAPRDDVRPLTRRPLLRTVALALAAAAAVAGCTADPPTPTAARTSVAPDLPARCTVSRLLVPSCGAWWGAAVEPGRGESQVAAVHRFERRIGRAVPVVHLYHRGDDVFPTDAELALATDRRHPRVLFFNWRPEGSQTWAQTAAGEASADARIDRVAARLRSTLSRLHRPFFLSITAEPEDEVVDTPGSGHTADDYRRMFRHVVERLRARGVTGAVTVMDYIAVDKWVRQPWFGRLYPGDDVVDWLGLDAYLRQSGDARPDFAALVHGPGDGVPGWPGFLRWAASVAPGKPVMLAEWGAITDDAHDAELKAALLRDFAARAPQFPQIKAYVYWNSARRLPVDGGSGTGDTEVESHPDSLAAFVAAVSRPYFARVRPAR